MSNLSRKKILIVDDESSIRDLIKFYLEKEDFIVLSAKNGEDAIQIISDHSPDLILLDIMLPDINGVDLCLEIRKTYGTPILFLSCKSQEIDKIIALSVGGDDYITKPFLPGELIARVKANLRRSEYLTPEPKEVIYQVPGMVINNTTREVLIDNKVTSLTAKEFDILLLFVKSPKRIYSAEQLFEYAWKEESFKSDKNTIMVYISNLRKKIDNNKNGYKYILSMRGLGYKFNHHLLEDKPKAR
ncbi:MAG: response regulator transcription factor [Clostridiales bacterium]|nr:response regulator transcription factor [Clostridiales bacterium]